MLLIKNLREKDGREIMARQLKDYKRKKIRCLIVENFETGRVFKVNKEEEFENIIAKYTKDEITKVYNPTAKQKAEIYEMMDIKNEEDKLIGTIEGVDLLIKVIPMLTDIEVDLDKEEDIELINEIVVDPNEVFNMVANELNSIILRMNLEWIDNLKLLNEMPDEVINVLANEM